MARIHRRTTIKKILHDPTIMMVWLKTLRGPDIQYKTVALGEHHYNKASRGQLKDDARKANTWHAIVGIWKLSRVIRLERPVFIPVSKEVVKVKKECSKFTVTLYLFHLLSKVMCFENLKARLASKNNEPRTQILFENCVIWERQSELEIRTLKYRSGSQKK